MTVLASVASSTTCSPAGEARVPAGARRRGRPGRLEPGHARLRRHGRRHLLRLRPPDRRRRGRRGRLHHAAQDAAHDRLLVPRERRRRCARPPAAASQAHRARSADHRRAGRLGGPRPDHGLPAVCPGHRRRQQAPARRPHRRVRLLLRHRREPHRRPHRLVVEPGLGDDDRDADGDLPGVRRRCAGRPTSTSRWRSAWGRWSASPPPTPARPRRTSRPASWSAPRRARSRSASSSAWSTATIVVGFTIRVLDSAAASTSSASDLYPAPQATLMATLIKGSWRSTSTGSS